jgi:predicted histone-like DNA-binding protein
MIRSKVVSKRNPKEPEAAPRFYASAVHGARVDLNSMAYEVSMRCTMSRADVHGVLVALTEIIPEKLEQGKIVAIDGLGTFCVNVKSEGAENPEGVSPALVKGLKLLYRPTKELKKKLRTIDVSIAK